MTDSFRNQETAPVRGNRTNATCRTSVDPVLKKGTCACAHVHMHAQHVQTQHVQTQLPRGLPFLSFLFATLVAPIPAPAPPWRTDTNTVPPSTAWHRVQVRFKSTGTTQEHGDEGYGAHGRHTSASCTDDHLDPNTPAMAPCPQKAS